MRWIFQKSWLTFEKFNLITYCEIFIYIKVCFVSAYVQLLSIIFNLAKLAITTTHYQRFRSQKLTGKQYPWYKSYKNYSQSIEEQVVLRRPQFIEKR